MLGYLGGLPLHDSRHLLSELLWAYANLRSRQRELALLSIMRTHNALAAVELFVPSHSQLTVLFGCGGDRDSGKHDRWEELRARLLIGGVTDDNRVKTLNYSQFCFGLC